MNKFINIVFLLLFSFLTINAQDAEKVDPETAKIVAEGDSFLKSGNYDGAVKKYDEALKSSQNYQIYYQKGIALIKLKKLPEATAALKKSLEKNPDNYAVYDVLGKIEYATKDYEAAIEHLQKYVEKESKASSKQKAKQLISKAYYSMGGQAKVDGNFEKAVELLQKSVEAADYDLAYLKLAEVYTDMGNYEKAIENADKALNSRKTISKGAPYYYKGMAFKKMGDLEKAKENFLLGEKDREYGEQCKYELAKLK